MDKRILTRGWCDINEDFFAENLKKVFCIIETPEEIALHNDMVRQIQILVEPHPVNDFLKSVARRLKNRPKDYLRVMASLIKQFAMKSS